MHGYVAFGSQIVLRVMRSTDDVLWSASDLRSPVSQGQAVVATKAIKGRPASRGADGEWWEVLGPAGTSRQFMHNQSVTDGARVRLLHSSGSWLRGDSSVASKVRRDLREVSCAAVADGSSNEEWTVLVDRGKERDTPSKRP